MTKVAVTGGAGFIGSNLTKRLLLEGYDVVVIDDLSTGLLSNVDQDKSTFHQISITDSKSLANALKDCETIFHLAARGSVPRSIKNPVATHEVNATGTLNVLEVARKSGAHVVFSSSSSVYGRNMQLPKDESMWLGPMTPYAASKLAAEGYVQAYASAYNVPTTLLRFFNVFGPRQRPDHEYAAVLPKWIWLAMQGKAIDVYGDGSASRDFTYVDDIVQGIECVVDNMTPRDMYSIGRGEVVELQRFVDAIEDSLGKKAIIEYGPKHPADAKTTASDTTKLQSIGYKPKTSIEEGVNNFVQWYRRHYGE